MPCYRPLLAHMGQKTTENGKRPLSFNIHEAYQDLPMMLPCGKCIGCKQDRANKWATRIVHESKLHTENCFLTLTYSDEYVPEGGSLNLDQLQKFLKRLREKIHPRKVRYYACGEYGTKLDRPHYHLILFGYIPDDRKLHSLDKSGTKRRYVSETIQRLWPFGFHQIGDVEIASALYVAKYSVKKVTGPKAEEHYKGKTPEFAVMSRNPGLAHDWITKRRTDVYPKDFFTINGTKHRPSRYYDDVTARTHPRQMQNVKNKRIKQAKENDVGGVRRYYVAEVKELIKNKTERRQYENELRKSVLRSGREKQDI